ncbi:OLC1v1020817C1 [Oldenlandia corymbosa var. corymbosa]|uniref:OLC1v1020817C1 n=1 Tax=Oldenlandia corymbosa var. corymbosa TaxID=529605 RepID=A0AAV1BUB9_OLDCO|nr:OLC1v1020817C1 [Oldenlandia corymbosa var. corymbosa]
MDGEIINFVFVWATVLSCLYYCHTVGKIFRQPSWWRVIAILPVPILFFFLPLRLTTIHLGGTTCFFIAWLSSFKLILFAFDKGPLSSSSSSATSSSVSRFIAVACFPIKPHQERQSSSSPSRNKRSSKTLKNYAVKIALLGLCIRVYAYKQSIPEKIIWFFYALHIYFMLEMILAAVASLARAAVGVELEQQFDEPYLATSLQDFWGRRWNLMVSNILRPTVYDPVRGISKGFVGPEWASVVAVVATFVVSGLMHELVFYNIGRVKPNGVVMCFFILHGVALAVELGVKRALKGKGRKIWVPPMMVSAPLTLGFVIYSSFWLFFPPLLRAKADWKGCTESLAFVEFLKHGQLVNPNNVTCPFLPNYTDDHVI